MAAKERKRPWLPLDHDYFNQDSIRELGDELGPAGPLVFLVILTEAKKAALAGVPITDQGTVDLRYRAVARTAFLGTDDALVRRVVELAESVGLLEFIDSTDTRFHVRLVKWPEWEVRDATATERQRRKRERDRADEAEMNF